MTSDDLRALAEAATDAAGGEWDPLGIASYDSHADTRLIALAPELALLCAELADALEEVKRDYLWGHPEIDAALTRLESLNGDDR